MFGVVPKPLWSRAAPADDQNRIQLETNCIVVRDGDHVVLIDSGYGTKGSEKERSHISADQPLSLVEQLAQSNIDAEDVTIVIPSHLHFDHAGGLTSLDAKHAVVPTFPRARHIVQQAEWEDALGDKPELAGNYFTDELQVLQDEGRFEVVQGTTQITDSIRVEPTGGHTRGHQIIRIASDDSEAVYLGDLCPTAKHLKTFWTMAYDQFPLDVRRLKPNLLHEATERRQLVLFDHEPEFVGAYLARDSRERIVIDKTFSRDQF